MKVYYPLSIACLQISMVPEKSGESKEKETVKIKVLKPWQTAESIGSEGTILGLGLKLPSFKVPQS